MVPALAAVLLGTGAAAEAGFLRRLWKVRTPDDEDAAKRRQEETSDFLERAQKAAHIGFYKFDAASGTWMGSQQLYEILGIGPDYPRDTSGWLSLVAPEQRQCMADYLERALRERVSFDKEYPIIRFSDGAQRWVRGLGTLEIDARGDVVSLIGTIQDVTLKRKAESELRESAAGRQLLAQAIDQAAESVVITDSRAVIQYVNPAFTRATGYTREEALGCNPSMLKSGRHDRRFYETMWSELTARRVWTGRMINRRKDGTLYEEDASIAPVADADGSVSHYVAVKRDVTRERSLEDQLREAQKMESIGRLAGGVAHDFNNILTAVNGYAQFVKDALPPEDAKRADVEEILKAGARAATLTRQLLAFSRKQILDLKVLDVAALAAGTANMLKRLIGENIVMQLKRPVTPCLALVDAGQIDQVLMNLAVNARDAMSSTGTLTISIDEVSMPEAWRRGRPELKDGPLVRLRVADTGSGMTPEVRARLFEPFFTTKEKGKGTGLGLSTVYGIVKQSGGDIEVESAPGRGTTFSIYLPAAGAAPAAESPVAPEGSRGGRETVLIVEDEEALRRMAGRILRGLGYAVLAAADGAAALETARSSAVSVDLLLTDVVLPGMSGRELALELARTAPRVKTLYMSGYSDNEVSRRGILDPGLALIEKPFTAQALALKVRGVLDGPDGSARV